MRDRSSRRSFATPDERVTVAGTALSRFAGKAAAIAMAGSLDTDEHVPIDTYRTTVAREWIDYNGHMNEGYYGVAFGQASDEYLIRVGFDERYRKRQRATFYTVETHVRFLRELKAGDPLIFRTVVLGVAAKKVHLFHSMAHETAGFEAATQEVLMLHVGLDEVAVTPMSPPLRTAIERDVSARPMPEGVGRSIVPVGTKP